MSLDQDYPISRTQVKVTVIGLVVLGTCFAILFGGLLPGLKPNYTEPTTIEVQGAPYYYTSVLLNSPAFLANSTSPQNVTFHNVSFRLWVTNWYAFSGGLVRGNGTEPNGTAFSFVLGESPSPHANATLYLTPDRSAGVYWPGGLLGGPWVSLLVRAG